MKPPHQPAPAVPAERHYRRVYAQPERFQAAQVLLPPAEAHHLRTVLRLHVGDWVEVTDGCGRVYRAEIRRLSADEALLSLAGEIAAPAESPLAITVGLAMVRADTFDLLIRQMTEMGVDRILPFYAERSLVRPQAWQSGKLERWRRIAQEALKSCQRTRLPDIAVPVTFPEALPGDEPVKLLCWEDLRRQPAAPEVLSGPRPSRVVLLIGPEGGFTGQEVAAAQQAGFKLLGLGPRRLRVETAAMAAVSLLQHRWGDLGP